MKSDYLDPRWQKRRLERLESAKWECQNCGNAEETLHVHHLRYLAKHKPWEYEDGDLAVLCAPCHASWHEQKAGIDYFINCGPLWLIDEIHSLIKGYALEAWNVESEYEDNCGHSFEGGRLVAMMLQKTGINGIMKAQQELSEVEHGSYQNDKA